MYHPDQEVQHGAGADKKGPLVFKLKLAAGNTFAKGAGYVRVTMSMQY
jgi:hypothetical protein